jgi:hypothetical protein
MRRDARLKLFQPQHHCRAAVTVTASAHARHRPQLHHVRQRHEERLRLPGLHGLQGAPRHAAEPLHPVPHELRFARRINLKGRMLVPGHISCTATLFGIITLRLALVYRVVHFELLVSSSSQC